MAQVGGFFSGTGGIEYAFRLAGAEIAYGCEYDRFARQTYERNIGHVPFGDITTLDFTLLPDTDIIVGGFPCPAFSKAGQAKNRSLGRGVGFDHPVSGQMFFHLLNAIKTKRPRAILLENVANLLTHDKGRTWQVIQSELEEAGYYIDARVIDGAVLVPQHRKRVYIVGFRSLADRLAFEWPHFYAHQGTQALIDILEQQDIPEYTVPQKTWEALNRHRDAHRLAGNGFGYSIASLDGPTRTLSARYYKDGAEILIPQTSGLPRRLTAREAFRLQGYPDSFQIDHLSKTQAYKQAGNAVVVPVVVTIAGSILRVLERELWIKVS